MRRGGASAAAAAALLWTAAAPGARAAEGGSPGPDALTALAASPSLDASDRLALLYRSSRQPDARLWVVDLLYSRALDLQDLKAFGPLEAACGDSSADVRRRALSALGAAAALPEGEPKKEWLARARAAAKRGLADKDGGVRAAARELNRRLDGRPDGKAPASAAAPAGGGRLPRGLPLPPGGWRRGLGVLAAAVSFQAAVYGWLALFLGAVRRLPWAARAARAWRAFEAQPSLYLVPGAAGAAAMALVGWILARDFMDWAQPGAAIPAGAFAWAGLKCYLATAWLAFTPSAALARRLAGRGGERRAGRLASLAALGAWIAAVVWPWELAGRALGLKPGRRGAAAWLGAEGAPYGGLLAAAVAGREGTGIRAALARAAGLFPPSESEAAPWARPFEEPAVVLAALAAPVLAAASLLPAMWWAGFAPAELFGFWFVSDEAFAVAFGVWAASLLAVAGWTHLMALGAVDAAVRARERIEETGQERRHP